MKIDENRQKQKKNKNNSSIAMKNNFFMIFYSSFLMKQQPKPSGPTISTERIRVGILEEFLAEKSDDFEIHSEFR